MHDWGDDVGMTLQTHLLGDVPVLAAGSDRHSAQQAEAQRFSLYCMMCSQPAQEQMPSPQAAVHASGILDCGTMLE